MLTVGVCIALILDFILRTTRALMIEREAAKVDTEVSEVFFARAQAVRLANWFAKDPIDAVYVSPMRRAVETAAPLADALGVEPVVDEELAEFDRDAHFYIPLEELKAAGDPRYQAMIRGEADGEVDQETFREVVAVAVERIVEAHAGDVVAVVCHGGVINAWASHVREGSEK